MCNVQKELIWGDRKWVDGGQLWGNGEPCSKLRAVFTVCRSAYYKADVEMLPRLGACLDTGFSVQLCEH